MSLVQFKLVLKKPEWVTLIVINSYFVWVHWEKSRQVEWIILFV